MRNLFAAFVLVTMVCGVRGADWPQWQGPDRDGKSPDTGLLKEWPEGGPSLVWRVDGRGGGDSAPAIAKGRIFAMCNRGDEEIVWALSETDGKEIWATPLGPAFQQRPGQSKEGPGCTPTVDGDRLYVEGLGGNVACLQVSDGKLLWQRSMKKEFGGRVPMWSYRESPLVDGDKVICTPGGPKAAVVALDKLTGKTLWTGTGPTGGRGCKAAYSSPIAIDFGGRRQYVQFLSDALAGFAASDGKLLWHYARPASRSGINCSTPIHEDGMVFACSAYRNGGGLVKLDKGADGAVAAKQVYETKDMQNQHGGMILHDGYLYGATGGNEGGALMCMDFKTGKVMWDQRPTVGRRSKGSVAMADGRIYYRLERSGDVVLFEPSPTEFLERGRLEQPDRRRQPAWAHPVIANGRLYIRDQDLLFCYDIKAK